MNQQNCPKEGRSQILPWLCWPRRGAEGPRATPTRPATSGLAEPHAHHIASRALTPIKHDSSPLKMLFLRDPKCKILLLWVGPVPGQCHQRKLRVLLRVPCLPSRFHGGVLPRAAQQDTQSSSSLPLRTPTSRSPSLWARLRASTHELGDAGLWSAGLRPSAQPRQNDSRRPQSFGLPSRKQTLMSWKSCVTWWPPTSPSQPKHCWHSSPWSKLVLDLGVWQLSL